jgi:hypothetical protein
VTWSSGISAVVMPSRKTWRALVQQSGDCRKPFRSRLAYSATGIVWATDQCMRRIFRERVPTDDETSIADIAGCEFGHACSRIPRLDTLSGSQRSDVNGGFGGEECSAGDSFKTGATVDNYVIRTNAPPKLDIVTDGGIINSVIRHERW